MIKRDGGEETHAFIKVCSVLSGTVQVNVCKQRVTHPR